MHLANELRGRIDEWSAAETILARPKRVDEGTVELRLVLRREPPVDEWGLILGDALHNFRGMLDNVVWALATLDGAVPAQPTQVTFPVTDSATRWEKRVASLESIPPDLLERLRLLQPWVAGVPREDSLLGVLHGLDITDKHQQLISSSLHLRRILMGALDFGTDPIEVLDEALISYEIHETPVALKDDAIVVTLRSDTRPLNVSPDYRARLDAQFAIVRDETRLMMLDTFMSELAKSAREWLDLIYGGALYAQQMEAARQPGAANAVFGYIDAFGAPRLTQLPMTRIGD
ncbi:hypothetical protein ACFQRL_14230 [Microbacterium fluvii]|uniref:Uncharacterized protein n=1 Tax=Microbacterium fluvii TaxID=415215 RepID=A0ABW2HGK7_9MICO|nr:hypothetical protein [Microbacterium fluvii]MCU4673747.1 hypothetical protein [Microbacterium fluvii]